MSGIAGMDGSTAVSLSEFTAKQFDQGLSWDSLEWIRAASDLPVVLKGIQRVEDARQAAALGMNAVCLSNHGGRQLDGAPAPFDLIEPVRDALGDAVEIICDGGVRRGSDIVKACARGADAVMVGRAYLYALAAGGERGVDWMIDHLLTGMRRTMALCGRTSVEQLGPDLFRP